MDAHCPSRCRSRWRRRSSVTQRSSRGRRGSTTLRICALRGWKPRRFARMAGRSRASPTRMPSRRRRTTRRPISRLRRCTRGRRAARRRSRFCRTAGAKFPTENSIVFELGAVLDKQKKYGDAEAAFRQVLTREPDNAAALNYLGYMLADRGERLDESVRYLTKALGISAWTTARPRQHRLAATSNRTSSTSPSRTCAARPTSRDQLRHPGALTRSCSSRSDATTRRSPPGTGPWRATAATSIAARLTSESAPPNKN